jgi:hypothetical protein
MATEARRWTRFIFSAAAALVAGACSALPPPAARAPSPASYAQLMVECPMEHLLAARFTPPEGGRATLVVPVHFITE